MSACVYGNIFSEKCAFYFRNVRSVNVKDVWFDSYDEEGTLVHLHGHGLILASDVGAYGVYATIFDTKWSSNILRAYLA